MFKIGVFSRISRVPVKTLRYYDEIGLFKPERVDEFTGYRYYSTHQLPRLNRILALKDLGLSLEMIQQLLAGDLTLAEMQGMLRLRQAEILDRIGEEQTRLAMVEARLKQIEQEGKMPDYDVVLKKVPPLTAASIRQVVPTYDQIGRLIGTLFAHIGRNRGQPVGPPMTIYYDEEFKERDADVEIAVPVATPVKESKQVTMHDLPGGEAATVIHQGSFETIGEAYAAAWRWIEENGYQLTGPPRELYINSGPGVKPEDFVTEIQIPVSKA